MMQYYNIELSINRDNLLFSGISKAAESAKLQKRTPNVPHTENALLLQQKGASCNRLISLMGRVKLT